MKISLQHFFMAFMLTAACFQLHAATVTWDGGAGTNNWTDAMNWDTDALPTASDDADLNGATVILSANTTVQRVYAGGSSDLTVNSGVTLTITGFAGNDDGLEVQGSATLTNNGTIAISNINIGSTDADGLYNKGTFTNNGTITVDNTGQHGIYLQGGTFTNGTMGTITVTNAGKGDSSADGLYADDDGTNASTLNNNGIITITMSNSDDCIYINDGSIINNDSTITLAGTGNDNGIRIDDRGIFNNNSGALFVINATPDDQLFLDLTGSFNNFGTVNLNNADDVGLYVTDDGVFTNDTTAAVNITGASNYAVQIDANGNTANIVNQGALNITGGSNDGIRLQEAGVFNNMATGALNITNAGDEGIQVDDGSTPVSTFNNSGAINITDATDHGMELFGFFNNMVGGTYRAVNSADDGIRMRNAGVFTNDGAIRISGSGSEDIETDGTVFTNSATASFAPGNNGIALMEIKDDLNMGAATIIFEISDTAATTGFDRIQNFSAGSALTVTSATAHLEWGSFIPNVGDKFRINFGSGDVTGPYSAVTTSNANIQTTINYTATEAEVEVTGVMSSNANITFMMNTANITVDPAGIFIAGGTNFGSPGDNPLTDADNDGIWEITMNMPVGDLGYFIFLNGNCPDYSCKEQIGGLPCSDPNNFNDRTMPTVNGDTTLLFCYETCSADTTCPTPPPTFDVVFRVDMKDETVDPLGVFLAGDFENFSKSIVMDDSDSDGIYEATVALSAGNHEYKFVNGDWPAAENFDNMTSDSLCTITDPSGQFVNRFLTISGDSMLTAYCYNSCFVCESDPMSINDLVIDKDLFIIRPNITSDYANIVFAENAIVKQKTIKVSNAIGQIVKTEQVQNTDVYSMNVNDLPAGMYFVNVQVGNRMVTKRLLIQR
ncbi:MAG: T9SS type A sorting domain-containing protein [Bacteroidia bacterium]